MFSSTPSAKSNRRKLEQEEEHKFLTRRLLENCQVNRRFCLTSSVIIWLRSRPRSPARSCPPLFRPAWLPARLLHFPPPPPLWSRTPSSSPRTPGRGRGRLRSWTPIKSCHIDTCGASRGDDKKVSVYSRPVQTQWGKEGLFFPLLLCQDRWGRLC